MTGDWYVYTLTPARRRDTLPDLRGRGVEIVMLMCFDTVRAHRSLKRRRPAQRKPVPALGDYVFVRIDRPDQWELIAARGKGLSRMLLNGQPAPRLSAKGRAWVQRPPRELFRDTDVPRLPMASAELAFAPQDRVGVYTHGFDGCIGEVVVVRGPRARVRFENSFFEIDVPVQALALVEQAEKGKTRVA